MRNRARGLAVVEFCLVLPVMLVMMFGIIDFGSAILTRQVLINLSRETANLASRGTPLADALAAAQQSAAPLHLSTDGYVILTEVYRDAAGATTILHQIAQGGRPGASRIGAGIGTKAVLPATTVQIPPRGQTLFVAELYYQAAPITPLGKLLNFSFGDSYYDVAFF